MFKNYNNLLPGLAIGLALLYVLLLPLHAALGPVDDHELLATIQSGHFLPFFIEPMIGRFYPLDGQEYNLIALLSHSPGSYYTFNALELICFAAAFYSVMRHAASRAWASAALVALLLTPGFVTGWFRLLVPERNELFLFSVCLACYLSYSESRRLVSFVLALLAANLALYEKETAFIMLGAFAFFRLLLNRKAADRRSQSLDLCLLASSFIYILVYFFLIYLHRGKVLYAPDAGGYWLTLAKNLVSYIISDPVFCFLLLPLALWRVVRIALRYDQPHALYDPLLWAAALYAVAYIKLNLSNVYYWLPAYAFGTPALAYFARQLQATGGFARTVLTALHWGAGILFAIAVVPAAIYLVIFSKYVPDNYQRMLDFMQSELQQPHTTRSRIFLEGVNRGGGVEFYVSLGRYLNDRGIGNDRFDLLSDIPTDNPMLSVNAGSPYRVFKSPAAEKVQRGDYVIVSPYSQERFMAISRQDMANYQLLFKTHSPWAIPDITLRSLLKALVVQRGQLEKIRPLAIQPMEYAVYRRL